MSRTILFDVDGVLIHGFHARQDLRRRWDQHLEADLGVDPAVFTSRFIREGFIKDVLSGRTALVAELERVLPELGYTGSPLTFASYWLARDSHLNQPLLAAIRTLRAGSGVGGLYVATNQEHLRAFHLWSVLGLQHVFDDIFYAARLGASKPDPAFFSAIAARIGAQDEPPLMVDDSPEVVDAVRAYGWDAVLYNELSDFTRQPWVAERLAGR